MRERSVVGSLLVVLGLLSLVAPAAASDWAPPRTVWVEDAGHTVDGLFLDEWRANPALLGEPLTEELETIVTLDGEKTGKRTIQYFENVVLAYVPDTTKGDEWKVQSLPLGEAALDHDLERMNSLELPERGSCGSLTAADCRRFGETGHTIRWGFKSYWDANGAGRLIGLPISEEFVGSNGWTTQYFERAVLLWKQGDDPTPRAIGRETAAREKTSVKRIPQPVDIPVYDEALFEPPIETGIGGLADGPGPQQGGYKEIVVSISQQSMWAYENGELITSTLVSTGTAEVPETVTPIGYYSVHTKIDVQTMEGTISNEYYNVPDVPWVMYFDGLGNALHGTYWHSNFGTPMSHGCVNLPLDIAEFLYGWADVGTPVSVIA